MNHPRHSFPFLVTMDDLVQDTGFSPNDVEAECRFLLQQYLELAPPHDAGNRTDNAKMLVIQTANHPWEVVDHHTLRRLIDPAVCTQLLYMPLGYPINPAGQRTEWASSLDCTGSPEKLIAAICKTSASAAYLKVSPHTKSEFLIPLILLLRPDIKLVVEFYDMGALFSRSLLQNSNGYNKDDINLTRFAAYMAAKHASIMIVKSTGRDWEQLAQSFNAKTFSWFPMYHRLENTVPSEGLRANTAENFRIAFAGSLGDTELTRSRDVAPGANFIETLALLMSHPKCTLAMFNAADRRDAAGPTERFRRVEEWFNSQGARHTYSPAIAETDLIDALRPLDLGFFCVHYAGQPVEHVGRLAIPNRAMAYLCAGLPIIVDRYAEAMADLINRFDAGICIDPTEYDQLPARIARSNPSVMRKGVMRLNAHIRTHNADVLEDLQTALPS